METYEFELHRENGEIKTKHYEEDNGPFVSNEPSGKGIILVEENKKLMERVGINKLGLEIIIE